MSKRLSATLLLSLFLVACSAGHWLLEFFYNRLDERSSRQIQAFAEFTPQQEATIDAAATAWLSWHRKEELPRYQAFLTDIDQQLARKAPFDQALLDNWLERAEQASDRLLHCHPLPRLTSVFRQLDDEQLSQIRRHLDDEMQDALEEYRERDEEERYQRLRKWFGRIGWRLDEPQEQRLRQFWNERKSMTEYSFALGERWNGQFMGLLQQRNEADFEQRLRDLWAQLGHQLQREYPDRWNHNRERGIAAGVDLLNSLNEQQRQDLRNFLGDTINSLERLQAETVADPSANCDTQGLHWVARTTAN